LKGKLVYKNGQIVKILSKNQLDEERNEDSKPDFVHQDKKFVPERGKKDTNKGYSSLKRFNYQYLQTISLK
jgi:hypothetical protein